jgi:hypothetical protein
LYDKINGNQTGDLSYKLHLCERTRYYITTNIFVKLGLFNGAKVELISICYDGITKQKDGIIHLKILPKVSKIIGQTKIFQDLNDNFYPIFPVEKNFSFRTNCLSTSITINRKEFALTHCFSKTGFKAQEKTLNEVVVDLSKPLKGTLCKSYAYVSISRCQSLENLFILLDFDIKILQQPIPINLDLKN